MRIDPSDPASKQTGPLGLYRQSGDALMLCLDEIRHFTRFWEAAGVCFGVDSRPVHDDIKDPAVSFDKIRLDAKRFT